MNVRRPSRKPLPFQVVIGFAVDSDLAAIVQLDRQLYGNRALRQSRWAELMASDTAVVLVARYQGQVVGYGIGVERNGGVQVQSVGLNRRFRRQGTGRALLQAIAKMAPTAVAEVCETNLVAQQWLRACGWKATGILRQRFGSRGDGIRFEQV